MAQDKDKQEQLRESLIRQQKNESNNYSEHVKNTDVTSTRPEPQSPYKSGGDKKDD